MQLEACRCQRCYMLLGLLIPPRSKCLTVRFVCSISIQPLKCTEDNVHTSTWLALAANGCRQSTLDHRKYKAKHCKPNSGFSNDNIIVVIRTHPLREARPESKCDDVPCQTKSRVKTRKRCSCMSPGASSRLVRRLNKRFLNMPRHCSHQTASQPPAGSEKCDQEENCSNADDQRNLELELIATTGPALSTAELGTVGKPLPSTSGGD